VTANRASAPATKTGVQTDSRVHRSSYQKSEMDGFIWMVGLQLRSKRIILYRLISRLILFVESQRAKNWISSSLPPWEKRKENDGNPGRKHGLTVTEEDGVEGREERAAEGVALAPPAPLPLRLGTVRPLRLVHLLPLLAHLHPPVLPLRRHCRPHLHRLHDRPLGRLRLSGAVLVNLPSLQALPTTATGNYTALRPAYHLLLFRSDARGSKCGFSSVCSLRFIA